MKKLLSIPLLFFTAVISFFIMAKLYPEYLWFQSFNYDALWVFILKSKIQTFALFFLFAYAVLKLNVSIANNISKKVSPNAEVQFKGPFQFINELFRQYMAFKQESQLVNVTGRAHTVFLELAILFIAFLLGSAAKIWWHDIYAYLYQTPFNITDPVFGRDIAFYFFTLPVIDHIQSWGYMLCLISLIMVAWIYFSKNILAYIFTNTKQSGIKKHLFILLGIFSLFIALGVYLNMLGLLYSVDGRVVGAGYTDIHAKLLGYKVVVTALCIQSVLFMIWAFRRTIMVPFSFFGITVIAWFLLLKIYPGFVQSYIVNPNELVKEKPYIERNISYTRMAYGLDNIEEIPFTGDEVLTNADIQANLTTIDNIRLWNPGPLKETLKQLQEIRLYYEFNHIDIDRYMINGKLQQVMLSPREMDTSQLTSQAQTWVNRHLVFTHGYGLSLIPVNEITPEGLPELWIKDLPPVSKMGIQITQPEIYFGERIGNQRSSYVIANTKAEEFNYPKGETNVFNQYDGSGGIQLDSLFKKFIYAYKFSDIKILISTLITPKSRLLYDRHVKQIVTKIAPFVIFEDDPYLVITDSGRLVWMMDGYTYSNKFPYSEAFNRYMNYIRNSFVVTIDAYNGDTQFYVKDQRDPIIQTYSKIYQDLFKPFDALPADLKQHIRYPKQLFSIQSSMYNTYHMSDPQVFYNREDLWETPQEIYGEQEKTMEPYYIVLKVPGEEKESFVMMRPFTPTNKPNMIAWLSASCDLDNYGKLKVLKFPKEKLIFGPIQIESRIDQDTEISQKLTLWDQKGSRVIRGNLMIVPINNSILYAEPIYLQATQSKLPELKRVILAHNDIIVMERTLQESLVALLGEKIESIQSEQPKAARSSNMDSLIQQLLEEHRKLKQASTTQNWERFGKHLQNIDNLMKNIQQYRDKEGQK